MMKRYQQPLVCWRNSKVSQASRRQDEWYINASPLTVPLLLLIGVQGGKP